MQLFSIVHLVQNLETGTTLGTHYFLGLQYELKEARCNCSPVCMLGRQSHMILKAQCLVNAPNALSVHFQVATHVDPNN